MKTGEPTPQRDPTLARIRAGPGTTRNEHLGTDKAHI